MALVYRDRAIRGTRLEVLCGGIIIATVYKATSRRMWRRHTNTGKTDAVLYTVSDSALMKNIGQYRALGKDSEGRLVQIVS